MSLDFARDRWAHSGGLGKRVLRVLDRIRWTPLSEVLCEDFARSVPRRNLRERGCVMAGA